MRQGAGVRARSAASSRSPAGSTVRETIARLRERPGVLSATPNYIARASFLPDDPGQRRRGGRLAGAAVELRRPVRRQRAGRVGQRRARRPPGRPAASSIAVLDTGVAYSDRGRFRRSPDLRGTRFARGHDFVDDDRFPHDLNGHGTHVASTIARELDNGVGVTGLAYGATIMPGAGARPRRRGRQRRDRARHPLRRAQARNIINLSFEFGATVRAREIPEIIDALRFARRKGVARGRRGRQRGRDGRSPIPRARRDVAVGRRHDRARLPRRVLEPGPDARPRRAGRRRRRRRSTGDPNCRPATAPAATSSR